MNKTHTMLGIDPATFLQSLSDEDRELFQRADLGVEIEDFLAGHPVGRFIANMLEVEREEAAEQLIRSMTQAPADHAEHMRHHRRVELCDMLKGWLLDAIHVGQEAQRELEARERSDG